MKTYRSTHLQKNLGEVQDAAEMEPVVMLNHGNPKLVMMSVEEFRRLKTAAGETVPPEALRRRRTIVQEKPLEDPLGQDTRDFWTCARLKAEAALSGRNVDAEREEIRRVERSLGMSRDVE